jgi:AraC-like DNA-binding protein
MSGICGRHGKNLVSAIRQGEPMKALKEINRITGIVRQSVALPLELVKGLAMELIISMGGACGDSGIDAYLVHRLHYEAGARLFACKNTRDVAGLLEDSLTRALELVEETPKSDHARILAKALSYMEQNLDRELTRANVARSAGISPSHFSRLVKRLTGRTFTDLLNQYRVDRAGQLLVRTNKNLAQVDH